MITPSNVMQNGDIVESSPMEPMFDCPILRTPFKRNLYRLYTTVVYVSRNIQLGLPMNHLSKLAAIQNAHMHILTEQETSSIRPALIDIHNLIFKPSPFKKDVYNPQMNFNNVVTGLIQTNNE